MNDSERGKKCDEKLNELNNLFSDVNSDTVAHTLNSIAYGKWGYHAELNNPILKVDLKIFDNCYTGYISYVDSKGIDLMNMTFKCIAKLCKKIFCFKTQITENKPNNELNNKEKHVTLDELENMNIENKGDTPFEPTPENNTDNKFGIRKDQIEFMERFQKTFKIDTTEKFDSYIEAWELTQSMYMIKTKKELVAAGPIPLDSFINWIKENYKENTKDNFIYPSEEDLNDCFK